MHQNLSTRHDWPSEKAIVDLPIRISKMKFKTNFSANETKLWLSLFVKQRRNPCCGSPVCIRIWVGFMIGLLKRPLSICQPGWKEIRNALLVIRWVRWEFRTRISSLLRRRYHGYWPMLKYVCDTGWQQFAECIEDIKKEISIFAKYKKSHLFL